MLRLLRRPLVGRNPRYFETAEIRFACTMCGACCHEWSGVVCIFESEIPAMAETLGMSGRAFRRRFVRKDQDGELELRLRPDGACAFFTSDRKCRVHPAKPILCRNFPVWKEVVASRTAFDRYARLCPGLGTGEVIPLKEIRRRLKENEEGHTPAER